MIRHFVDYFCLNQLDLIYNLVVRNLKRKYRRSYLGFFWSLLVPLLTAFTYMVVFSFIMRLEVDNYLPLIVMNILTWTMFAIVATEGLETIFANFTILSKVPIEIHNFNYSTVVTNMINYLCSLPVIVFFLFRAGLYPTWYWLWFPVLLVLYFLICYFVSITLSILYVHFRDMKHLFGVIIQLWMYASPILYPESMYPPNLKFLVYLNPLAPFFVCLQKIFIERVAPPQYALVAFSAWAVVLLIISMTVYNKFKDTVLENV